MNNEVREKLEMLRACGVKWAEFASDGGVARVEFFAVAPATDEPPIGESTATAPPGDGTADYMAALQQLRARRFAAAGGD